MSIPVACIAVVDDEPKLRVALRRLLRTHGIEARLYSSGEAFLAADQGEPPDCLVLDLHMPGATGFDVLRSLRRRGDDLPVILITGRDEEGTEVTARQLGAAAYLLKPLDESDLMSAIQKVCAR